MGKTGTLTTRVNLEYKKSAEEVLKGLGISLSAAIDLYLYQITYTKSIPFNIALPDAPKSIDADQMSDEELLNTIREGIDDAKNGRTMDLDSAYEIILGKKK